jgi:uncharacterized protein YbjT (DUF2867 family)
MNSKLGGKQMILITGATGNVGREIIKQISNAEHPIRVLSRNPEKGSFLKNVEVTTGNLSDPESIKDVLKGVKKVFLINVPGSDQFSQIAKQSGIEHITFLSAAAIEYPDNAIGQAHSYTEELIRQSGVKWTFLRPGAFMSNTLQWIHSIQSEGMVRMPFGDVRTSPIDPRDIAAVAVNSLLSSGHEGKIYTLTGPENLSPREQTRILSTVLGEDIRFENISRDLAKENMIKAIPVPIVEASLDLMEKATDHPLEVFNTVKEVTGQESRTFKKWATDHKELFQLNLNH